MMIGQDAPQPRMAATDAQNLHHTLYVIGQHVRAISLATFGNHLIWK
jgi:hypothetical protein